MGIFRPALLSEAEAHRIIQTKLQWILESCEPEEIWLFGSAATDTMTVASDVDLALLFRNAAELSACRKSLYAQSRPDAWPQDLAFFVVADFYERAAVGGLPMLIVQEGKQLFPQEAK